VTEGDGNRPIMDMDAAETDDRCRVPVTTTCQSCGMPMFNSEQCGGGDEEKKYCVHCCHQDGSLKSYGEVLGGMVGVMMSNRGLDKPAAEKAAREYMATMPAWSGHR
jgi:hypothetical protein